MIEVPQAVPAGPIRLLLIEDDRVDQLAFERAVREERLPYDWSIAGSVAEARAALGARSFDIVITDYTLGDGLATEVFPLMRATPFIVTTASGDEEVAVQAMKTGASDYLIKDPQRNYLKVLPYTVQSALARKRDQDRVEQLVRDLGHRSAALAVANRELEAFSYSVAHDLRAPLRAINGFTAVLMEDHAATLDAEGGRLLQRIVANTENMGRLIDGLLALSRLERVTPELADINLSEIATAIAEQLQAGAPERPVEWLIAPELRVRADPRLIKDVLENLLGNAWKFTSHHARARIEFGARAEDGKLVYFVRDDGAGFDPAHASRLFQSFQRLHRADQFPGTGIGLATVRRIIGHHGGELRAESEVEKGACFRFTLGMPAVSS